jgi:hypothetical protein
VDTPLKRAQSKCEQLERELRRSPDFHLYLLTKSRLDQARMEGILMEIPQFALWRTLTKSVERALCQSSSSMTGGRDAAPLGLEISKGSTHLMVIL